MTLLSFCFLKYLIIWTIMRTSRLILEIGTKSYFCTVHIVLFFGQKKTLQARAPSTDVETCALGGWRGICCLSHIVVVLFFYFGRLRDTDWARREMIGRSQCPRLFPVPVFTILVGHPNIVCSKYPIAPSWP